MDTSIIIDINKEEKKIIDFYRSLDEEEKRTILDFIETLTDLTKNH